MSQDALKWLETLGGPFLLLAKDHLCQWHGNDEGGEKTDYDRLSTIFQTDKFIDAIELIDVGDSTCLVLVENLRTTWVAPRGTQPGMFVGWQYANSEQDVVAGLKEVPEDIFTMKTLRMTVESRENRLFDSVYSGVKTAEEGYLEVDLEPGEYEAQAGEHKPDPHTSLLITRLVRRAGGK